jgi:hypothetical protein
MVVDPEGSDMVGADLVGLSGMVKARLEGEVSWKIASRGGFDPFDPNFCVCARDWVLIDYKW